eukprot:11412191-Prorocentrum_lima.AAC.1
MLSMLVVVQEQVLCVGVVEVLVRRSWLVYYQVQVLRRVASGANPPLTVRPSSKLRLRQSTAQHLH